jgi:Tfp pilus assembly protein PilV
MSGLTPRRRRVAGYTFVELLMSMSILTIGVGGIAAMQKVTVNANQHARNLATATQISQAWLDALRTDATSWNHPSTQQASTDLGQTQWLSALAGAAGTTTGWYRPAWQATRLFGPAFDVMGRPLDTTVAANTARIRFCTHLRLTWLYRDTGSSVTDQRAVVGNGLIRTEVRVFWVRDGKTSHVPADVCGAGTSIATLGAATDTYHFVYQVSAVRQNTAVQ